VSHTVPKKLPVYSRVHYALGIGDTTTVVPDDIRCKKRLKRRIYPNHL